MKKLYFQFKTELRFSQLIHTHNFALRMLPSNDAVQTIHSLKWEVIPAEHLCINQDAFGNQYCTGNMMAFHDFFQFQVEGYAFVDVSRKKKESLHPIYQYVSEFTSLGNGLHSFYGACCCALKGSAYERAIQIMNLIYGQMEYCSGVTGIKTVAEESFQLKKGVCQDYAHILIALCRQAGIPARYVAGMMIGEGATHAWVEIYEEGCWHGLDPTNNKCVDDGYIKLSVGRDYGDCAIDRGCFKGYALQQQKVSVIVREIG